MRKAEIDRLLETAVAKALNVSLPRLRPPRPLRKPAQAHIRRAA